MNSKKVFYIILLTVGGFVFFFNLGGRDLWDPDETRYAVIAREMRETGNWILPYLNGKIYAEKPPLFFWLVNFSVIFLGEDTEFANRLPSALAGLLTFILTFIFGAKLFNHRVGFIAALILGTCLIFPQVSRWMVLDSLFTLLSLFSLLSFYRGFENTDQRRKYFIMAGFFIGLGVLTKGPAAFLNILIFLIFAFIQKERERFWNKDLLYGFIFSLTIILIWLIPACWLGGEDYSKRIIIEQSIGRLSGSGKHVHSEPFFFYFIRFPAGFFPWTVFLPSVFIWIWKERKWKEKSFRFLMVWFSVIFLFFTLSKGKKDTYILPLYPAAAMIVGSLWDSSISSNKGKGILFGFTVLIIIALILFVVSVLGMFKKFPPEAGSYDRLLIFISIYLFFGLMICLFFFLKDRKEIAFFIFIIIWVFFHLHISYVLPPKLNPQRSMKEFSKKVLQKIEIGDELKTCFFTPLGLLYYTKNNFIEKINTKERFLEVFQSSQRVFMVIQRKDLDRLKKEMNIEIHPIEEAKVGHWDLLLVSNR